MHKAVDNMKKESSQCFMFFALQLFCFHMSSFLLMWTMYSKPVAIAINIILAIFLVLFVLNGKDIYDKLAVSEIEAVSGKFTNFAQYEDMEELDKERKSHDSQIINSRGRAPNSQPALLNFKNEQSRGSA